MATFISQLKYFKVENGFYRQPGSEHICDASPIDVFERLFLNHRVSEYDGSPILSLDTIANSDLNWLQISEGDDECLSDYENVPLNLVHVAFPLCGRDVPFYSSELIEIVGFTDNVEVKKLFNSYFP